MQKVYFPLVAVLLVACVSVAGYGSTWYVNGSVAESGDGTSPETAFKTIQEGIDVAVGGDAVSVAPWTYFENIHFDGKNIVLCSDDPLDPAGTVIDGDQSGSVVTFVGTENETCVLSGFTIKNGSAAESGGGICGGSWSVCTHATIQNNILSANSALWVGGGIAFCSGAVQNNVFTGNSAGMMGGGLYDCDGNVQNNTVVGNSGGMMGGGVCDCSTVQNCIIWGNTADIEPQAANSTPTYSCIQDWGGVGDTNISSDPMFVDPDGPDNNSDTYEDNNYRLASGSPCIDAGTNAPELPVADLDGLPRIVDGNSDGSRVVDMGAFEFQVPAPDIEVSPLSWDFGEVELGESATTVVTVGNVGETSLQVGEVVVEGSEEFYVSSCPTLPIAVEPFGAVAEIGITYAPLAAGPASAVLRISSNDPNDPVVSVALSGTGLAGEQSPSEQITEIADFLHTSVEGGSLAGNGPGGSASGRLNALSNMLDVARALVEGGYYEEACAQLLAAYRRTDGVARPPDFVSGDAASDLAEMILELVEALRAE